MVYIYVLKLKSNKYYVGKTNDPKSRLDSHFNSNGSAWTKKYQPINIHELIPDRDSDDEDKYTRKYMRKYGMDNVRGGSFCQINLNDNDKKTINKMICSSTDKCYICGNTGHFANNCKKKTTNYYSNNNEETEIWSCKYCNKEFDSKKGATFHENVHCKKKKTNYNPHPFFTDEETEIWSCKYCNKEFDSKKGATFHENVHCKKKKTNYYSNKKKKTKYYSNGWIIEEFN